MVPLNTEIMKVCIYCIHAKPFCVPIYQVSVLDAAAMGEVLETFIVSSTPVQCITAIPGFDDNDPDVLTSQSTRTVYIY